MSAVTQTGVQIKRDMNFDAETGKITVNGKRYKVLILMKDGKWAALTTGNFPKLLDSAGKINEMTLKMYGIVFGVATPKQAEIYVHGLVRCKLTADHEWTEKRFFDDDDEEDEESQVANAIETNINDIYNTLNLEKPDYKGKKKAIHSTFSSSSSSSSSSASSSSSISNQLIDDDDD
jgi:hypothetical protein